LDGVPDLDTALLETLRGMSAHLEVASQPPSAWRQAVLDGFTAWRELVKNGGGYVSADLDTREIRYLGPPDKTITTAAAAEAE
jgi:hypothetical protein